jgi:hypothetical protein
MLVWAIVAAVFGPTVVQHPVELALVLSDCISATSLEKVS